MLFVSLAEIIKTQSNTETTTTIRRETIETIETTIENGRITRGVALIEIARVSDIVRSPSTSPSLLHLVRKMSIVTGPKRTERPVAVLENMLNTAPTAVEGDLRVRAISPLQMNEGEEALVIRMLPHPLTLLFLGLPTLYLLRIRIPVLPFRIKIC